MLDPCSPIWGRHATLPKLRRPMPRRNLQADPDAQSKGREQVGVADEVVGGPHPNSRPPAEGGHRIGRATNTAVHAAPRPPAALPQRQRDRHGPHPVVRPRDRRGEQHRQRAQAGAEHPVARAPPGGAASSTTRASGTATASHRTVGGAPSSSRVSAPYADWLWASAGGPTRPRRGARRSIRRRAPGIAAKPITTVPANVMAARPAAVRRPTRTRSTTNTSGVSFTPAAMPTSTPDQRRSGRPGRPAPRASAAG